MRISAIILLAMTLALPGPVLAQTPQITDGPVLLKADEVEHERDLNVVVARGNVELVQGDRILRADTVSFNQKDDVLTATGNVVMLEPDGDVVFADHAEVTGDFKDGIVENIKLLLTDNSRAVATNARLSKGKVAEMRRGVYTPCQTCASGNETPIWQIKAYRITHNREEKIIEYRDAFMEIYGVPVAYTPYLSHPDPTVKRKSGLLPISGGSDRELGAFARIPYFIVLDDDKDMTVELMPTTKGGQVLINEYRQRFGGGLLEIDTSATVTDIKPAVSTTNAVEGEDKFRGHIFGHFRYNIDENWRTGSDIAYTADDTYLQRYGFSNEDVLDNQIYVENFRGDNYAAAKAFYWQDLRASNLQGTMPIVAPQLLYNYVSPTTPSGGTLTIDGNMLMLSRTLGTDSRRISVDTTWTQRGVTRGGHVLTAFGSLQTDAYHASEVTVANHEAGDTSSGFTGRIYPRVGVDWRYPLEKFSDDTSVMVTPIAGLMASPNGGNPDLIPNEDSQVFEFDDTNLTSRNLFAGRDRVEGGQRAYYGMEVGAFGPQGYSSAFFGQTYRFQDNDTFLANSGVDDRASDYVGRVILRPVLPVETIYRFHLDKDNLSFRRNSLLFNAGPPAFNINLNYDFFDVGSSSGTLPNREEIFVQLNTRLTDDWSARASVRHDLINKFTSNQFIGFTYTCDCFTLDIGLNRSFVRDREIEPTDTFLIQLTFKNLGTFATAQSLGGSNE